MGVFAYTDAVNKIATGALNLNTADIRMKALSSNTTAGTEEDVTSLAGFTTIDEYDGAGYAEKDLAAVGATKVDASDRTEVDADDGTFGATVSAGTRPVTAVLFYIWVDGTDANDFPLSYDDSAPQFPQQGDGGPMNFTIPTVGFLHVAA